MNEMDSGSIWLKEGTTAAIGFAAGATAQIVKKQLDAGKKISPDDFSNIMASFLAGAVNGGRFTGN